MNQPLRELVFEYRPPNMSDAEADHLVALVTKMLKYDSKERISVAEALQEPRLDAQEYALADQSDGISK